MYYLPKTKELGELSIQRFYSFYDVPRTFLAVNHKSECHYLVYWFAESENEDSWYYASVNEGDIKNLESGRIQIRDFFIHKNLMILWTPYDLSPPKIASVHYQEVNLKTLPPERYFVGIDEKGEFSIGEGSEIIVR